MDKLCPNCGTRLVIGSYGSSLSYCPNKGCDLYFNKFQNHYTLIKVVG